MIPLKDEMRSATRPIVNYCLVVANVIVYLYELSLGRGLDTFIAAFGAVPNDMFHSGSPVPLLKVFSSMFIHANFVHILGNMLFLWVFGDNIEDRIGHVKFFFFYLIAGMAGALLHGVSATRSEVPMIGASGAISGVLGAYILLYPRARVLALVPVGFFMRVGYFPSYFFIGLWFLLQFLSGMVSLGASGGGVAYLAHIGGFVVGALLALPFMRRRPRGPVDYWVS